jgi:hypothetical protein
VRRRAAAVALAAALALAVAACSDGGDGNGNGSSAGQAAPGHTSTTLNAGDIKVDTPDGWQAIPVPDLGFGLAVPPGWETTLLSPDGLRALARSSPLVPDFKELAHAAAQQGGLLYAAGVDTQKGVSDVVVRGAPDAGVKDVAGLKAYAKELATRAGRADQEVTVVKGAKHPTVQMRYQVGSGAKRAQATDTLVAGPNDVVWDITVTSDTAASHDELVRQITDTFTLGTARPGG